ncbi:MAG TPA: putative ABC transporter permease [Candidatus Blautia faecavium]|uniref:ABC transporter permease n=1 Tax=Candidatus Blautia faecavium TaxID=2838487 RepID=A0A9D2RWR8_9FIRM|nr:putative ABC transporter permease [Candidatus Blautia faecavium]
MNYTFTELLWLLLVYSFLGWTIETVIGTIKNKKFINRGFSTGPFCLVYGFAAILMAVTTEDLSQHTGFLFIGCGILATAVEWFTGKLLERLNSHKWWDYSEKRWNYDGYICLQYSILWAVLGTLTVRYTNKLFLAFYRLMPQSFFNILIWILAILVFMDIAVSAAAVLHIKKESPAAVQMKHKISALTYKFGLSLVGYVERRMAKAYPVIMEKNEEIRKEGKFAEGCGFYKLFWLFFIGSLLGDIVETIFCRITAGVWMSRSSLVWGPFSIVWGLAIVFATVLLYKDREKPDRHLFLVGTFLGGAYEYICSVLSELVFGKVFWDYSKIPFNLDGRINLLYCFFWGIAAVVWIKGLYPKLSGWIEKIPKIWGYILTWILAAFMTVNMLVSGLALIRYDQRAGGPPAASGWEHIIDTHFDDSKMQQIYPNAISK